MRVPKVLVDFFKREDKFLILTHVNPEPDALGSAIALSIALERLNKKTWLFNRDEVPEIYKFLPGYEKIRNSLPSYVEDFNLVLLDCNNLKRAGIEHKLGFKSSAVIDHHETEDGFGDIRWIVPDAAATGLLIFYLIKELGLNIDDDIALNLYSAIAIDTGTFRYNNTNPEVMRVSAELIESGVEPSYVANCLYNMWSRNRFSLLIMSLNTLELRDGIAFTHVTIEMLRKTNTKPPDTENFANFPRMMGDVKVSVFLRQDGEDRWKVSLRSKDEVNVAYIASEFNGGGHKNAAGFFINGDLDTVKDLIYEKILSKFTIGFNTKA